AARPALDLGRQRRPRRQGVRRARRAGARVSAFVWVFLPLLIAFEATLRWCWDLWWTPDWYFAHGPLVPPVMALVFWRRRAQWRRRPAALDPRAWWLPGPALFVHLCGAALTIDPLSAVRPPAPAP